MARNLSPLYIEDIAQKIKDTFCKPRRFGKSFIAVFIGERKVPSTLELGSRKHVVERIHNIG
jgi:hypothetical protein